MNCPYCNNPCEPFSMPFRPIKSSVRYQCNNCIGTPAFLNWDIVGMVGSPFDILEALQVNFIIPIYKNNSQEYDDFTSLTFRPNTNQYFSFILGKWFTVSELITPNNVLYFMKKIENLKVFS